jgi:hypothetical protein
VVHGDHDPVLPLPHGPALREAAPGATSLVLEGAGHDLPRPLWDVFVPALLRHTAGGRPAGRPQARHPVRPAGSSSARHTPCMWLTCANSLCSSRWGLPARDVVHNIMVAGANRLLSVACPGRRPESGSSTIPEQFSA